MDRNSAQEWLSRYVSAWKSYDSLEIGALFSEDATYQYHPFDEPVRGRSAIVESWVTEDRLDRPGTYDGSYRPIALDGDLVVANGRSRYFRADGAVEKEYDNIFLMRFDQDGRCREFREWYMPRRGQTG
jgi:ketosteroid isomerase-like protein